MESNSTVIHERVVAGFKPGLIHHILCLKMHVSNQQYDGCRSKLFVGTLNGKSM